MGTCNPSKNFSLSCNIHYPFRLADDFPKVICEESLPVAFGDYSSSSQFYVFVGVLTFLLSFGMILLYTLFVEYYSANDNIRKADFIGSIVVTILWFIASIVWADGVEQLKRYSGGQVWLHEIDKFCSQRNCTVASSATYAGLNISLVFGFANVGLWAASLWFLWKETPWFRGTSDPLQSTGLPGAEGGTL